MKKIIAATLIGVAAIGSLAITSTDADARTYYRGGGRIGGARIGAFIAAPIIASSLWYASRPYYYGYPYAYGPYPYGYGYAPAYAPAYYPPVEQPGYYAEQQPPVAMGPSAPPESSAPQTQQQQYWFFCQDTQTYYPHVQNCATPWQRVVPHAPR